MNLRNLRIGVRAAIGFAILTALCLAVGLIGLLQMQRMNAMSDEINDNWMPSVAAVSSIGQTVGRVRALGLRVLISEPGGDFDAAQARLAEAAGQLRRDQERYEALISSSEERQAYEQFRAALTPYLASQAKMLQAAAQGDRAAAIELVTQEMNAQSDAMMRELGDLAVLNQQGSKTAAQRSDDLFSEATWSLSLLLGVAVLASIAIAVLITRGIVRPLSEALGVARRIAAGDLSEAVRV